MDWTKPFIFRYCGSTLSYMHKHILRNWGVQNKNVMGLLSFTSAFEISIKHSKEEAFKRFLSYVNQSRNLKLTETEEFEKMSFTKGTSLFSWPIEFSITFKEIDKDSTQLSVSSASSSLDFGQAKGIINDIVKEIY